MKKELTIFDKLSIKIAKQTLSYSDVGAKIMGGMSKREAREVLVQFGIKYKEE